MKHTLLVSTLALAVAMLTACGTSETKPPEIPKNELADIYVKLGIGYMQEGEYEQALRRLQRALELEPRHAEAHDMLGLLYQRLGAATKAEEHFRRAVELAPKDSRARTNFGTFLCTQNRHKAAEEQFLAAVKNPLYDSPEIAYTNAGLCMVGAGDLNKAENYLRRALQINPRVPMALLRMAVLSYESSRYLPARAYLERYREVGPQTAESLWLGYRVEERLGDKDAAASHAMLLKARFPDSHEVRLLQGTSAQ